MAEKRFVKILDEYGQWIKKPFSDLQKDDWFRLFEATGELAHGEDKVWVAVGFFYVNKKGQGTISVGEPDSIRPGLNEDFTPNDNYIYMEI